MEEKTVKTNSGLVQEASSPEIQRPLPVQRMDITKKKSKSFAVTLTIAFLYLVAAVIIVNNAFNAYISFDNARNLILSEQKNIAQSAALTVKNFIDDKLRSLAQSAYVNNLISSPDTREIVMNKLIGLVPSFRQLFLVDIQGKELYEVSRLSVSGNVPLTSVETKDLLFQTGNNKNYIGKVFFDSVTQEPIITIAVPIKDILGDIRGAYIAEVNLKFMWDLVGSIKIGESGSAYVVDRSGNLIAFGDVSRVLARENLKSNAQAGQFMKGNNEGVSSNNSANISKGINGSWVVANFVGLNSPDWAVVIEIPAMEAYESVISQIGLSGLIALITALCGVFVTIYLSRKITKPITDLTNVAKTISEGDFSQKARIEPPGEIEILARTFNDMTDKLQEYQKGLERKIQEKTKDLEIKIQELEKFNQLTVGRELKMIELKKELAALKDRKG
jgi:methyl-accepting chemotaxis protein